MDPGVALAAILVLAAFLRFYRLRERGILLWDDGLRLREVLFVHDLSLFLEGNLKGLFSRQVDFKAAAKNFRGRFLFENPLNIVLYAIASRATGDIENSAYVINWLFSLFGIWLVYSVGAAMFGLKVGLIAAFLLAISGYHLLYSRSVHAEVTSGTFRFFIGRAASSRRGETWRRCPFSPQDVWPSARFRRTCGNSTFPCSSSCSSSPDNPILLPV